MVQRPRYTARRRDVEDLKRADRLSFAGICKIFLSPQRFDVSRYSGDVEAWLVSDQSKA